jgi:hypothetical protein
VFSSRYEPNCLFTKYISFFANGICGWFTPSRGTIFIWGNCLQHQPWWWRQYGPLRLRSTSTRLQGPAFKKAVIFNATLQPLYCPGNSSRCQPIGCLVGPEPPGRVSVEKNPFLWRKLNPGRSPVPIHFMGKRYLWSHILLHYSVRHERWRVSFGRFCAFTVTWPCEQIVFGHLLCSRSGGSIVYVRACLWVLCLWYCNVPGVLFTMEVYFRSIKSTHYS